MKRLFALVLLLSSFGFGQSCPKDQYKGYTCKPSANIGNGWFRTEKMGGRWMFVDPDNNAWYSFGIYAITRDQDVFGGTSLYATANAKYGNPYVWADKSIERMQSWGFNTALLSEIYTQPTLSSSSYGTGDTYIGHKAPFFINLQCSRYAMRGEGISHPVKNLMFGGNRDYDPYWRPSDGEADYYDSGLYDEMTYQMSTGQSLYYLNLAPLANKKYLLGIALDESDQTYSLTGPSMDFATYPETGYNHGHGAYRVAIAPPNQAANDIKGYVYADTLVYTKKAWRDFLAAKYSTIGALNTAWGSTYTTFDSSGTSYTSEAVTLSPAPNGSSLGPFTFTLAHSNKVTWITLQLFKGGALIAGDVGAWPYDSTVTAGSLFGSTIASGSVNYSTGAVTVTFKAGNAPTSQNITANYSVNGWGVGTGLLDENGRHTAWMGTNAVYLTGANANTKQDLSDFYYTFAKYYFTNGRTKVNAYFNTMVAGWQPLFTGTDMYGGYNVPAPKEVLKAAGESVDFIVLNATPDRGQAFWDYLRTNYGDRPLIVTNFTTANLDSPFVSYTDPSGDVHYTTQTAKGQAFYDSMTAAFSYVNSGSSLNVGYWTWKWADQVPSHESFGFVTVKDNAYDGHEAVTGSVACSAPLAAYTCGGEAANYGNYLQKVIAANTAVDNAIITGVNPTPDTGSVSLTPSSYGFGNQTPNTTSSISFTLANGTASGVTLTSFATSGTGFSISGSTGCAAGTLASGASCQIVVNFTPVAVTSYSGTLSAVLSSGTLTSTLSGAGFTPISTTIKGGWGRGGKVK